MSTGALTVSGTLAPRSESPVPAVPWRDPQTVSRDELARYIGSLEQSCRDEPNSPAVWTCLGMAHAVNYDVPRSMQSLQRAIEVAPTNFWARLKYAELHYRVRTLNVAEEETLKAVDLAENPLQLAMARKQLRDIRAINYRRVALDGPKSSVGRALYYLGLLLFAIAVVMWK